MGTEVWVKPPTNTGSNFFGKPKSGYLGWLCNTGDRAFGNFVYVRPLDGQDWYEEVVEKTWWGKETARYWVIKKETLDDIRNAFYNAWNSFAKDPRTLEKGLLESPWGINLNLDEATELACLMAGLKDETGWDHINDLWEEIKSQGLNTLDDSEELNGA